MTHTERPTPSSHQLMTALTLLVICASACSNTDEGLGAHMDHQLEDMASQDLDQPQRDMSSPEDLSMARDLDLPHMDLGSPADMTVLDSPTLVTLPLGRVRGTMDSEQVVSFKAIPYARPPIGEFRFKAPAPLEPWDGELDATSWPEPCPQLDPSSGDPIGQEDCLFLNIWKPTQANRAPVIVFIHGGGNMFGSTSQMGSGVFTYEGKRLAERTGAVVVTLQYRLNTLGYMSLEVLDDEEGQTSGNWGLRDQVAALKWVQEHIAAFGGDAQQVMLFGESGGAASVCGLVATAEAAGLFRAAIMQSGGCGGQTVSTVRAWSQEVVEGVGCARDADIPGCLRDVDALELARVSSSGGPTNQGIAKTVAGPLIDGVMLPNSPLVMMKNGTHNKVPLVFGVNADETASPLFGIIGRNWTQAQYEQYVRTLFGAQAESVLQEYEVGPSSEFRRPIQALIALTTDLQFTCPTRAYARAASEGQQEPVYRFLFDHTLTGSDASVLGAFHGLELIYNFQHMSDLNNYTPVADDLYVEDALKTLWLDFASSGEPSMVDGVLWQPYDTTTDPYLVIDSPLVMRQGLRTQKCDLLESLRRN